MAVTAEQWAAAAADAGTTVEELRERIAKMDTVNADQPPTLRYGPAYVDRDGDPLTLGEWSWLYESRSYKFIAETTLPNGYWVATIWHGVRGFDDNDHVLETSVFPAPPSKDKRLPSSVERITHASMEDALRTHALLIARYAATAP